MATKKATQGKPAIKKESKVSAPGKKVVAKKTPAKKVAAKKAPVKKAPGKPKKVTENKPVVTEIAVTEKPVDLESDIAELDPTQALADELGLTPRQKRFGDEYLIDLNGTQAAIRAGYSAHTANEQASRLLANVSVKAYVDKRNAELAEKTGLTAELVRRQWLGILTADTNELMEFRRTCCRYCHSQNHRYQRTAGEMELDRERYNVEVARLLLKDPDAEVEPFDEKGGIGFVRNAAPNPECPECCGEGVGDVFFKDTRNLSPGARELYAGAKIGKDGIEVKSYSKDGVREIVAKHLKMFEEKDVEVNVSVTATNEALNEAYRRGMEQAQRKKQEIMERRNAGQAGKSKAG